MVDLRGGGPWRPIAEDTPADTLLALHWDAQLARVVGIWADGDGLALHAVDPASGRWLPPRPVTGAPADWNTVLGNEGTVSAFNARQRTITLITGVEDGGDMKSTYLAAVNVDTGAVETHPPLNGDAISGGLMALAMVGA